MNKGTLVVISGFSGAGKGTVLSQVLARRPDLYFSVSFTTRPPREGEKDGVNYHFVTRQAFQERIERGEFLEYAEYVGNFYGTSMAVIREKLDDMHKVEHAADEKKHEVLDALVKAFITPIEREDIILLSQNIDEVTDKIEDVMLRLYYNNIQSIRPDSLELVSIVVKSCDMVKLMLKEFASFRHSKSLRDHIIAINTLEEQADQVFVTSMRELHTTCTDPLQVLAWHEVYVHLELCTDDCEHVADVVDNIVMENS